VIDVPSALGWGTLATAALTLVMSASQGLGLSRMSLPYMLGTMFSGRRSRAMAIGLALHFSMGVGFAVVYALLFEGFGRSGPLLGASLGVFHAAFVLVVGMEALPAFHPRMATRHHGPTPTRQLEPPGWLALNYGMATPLSTLAAHVAYGAILGACYSVSAG
jgi:hypothetical protein